MLIIMFAVLLSLHIMHIFMFASMIAIVVPDSKLHGANMGPTWVLSAPDGPHVGPMNLAMRGSQVNVNAIHNTGQYRMEAKHYKPQTVLECVGSLFHWPCTCEALIDKKNKLFEMLRDIKNIHTSKCFILLCCKVVFLFCGSQEIQGLDSV